MGLTLFGRIWDRLVVRNGHRTLGRITLYAFDTAMHGAIEIWTPRWGCLCLAWPRLGRQGTSFRACAYLSPNATPWAATWMIGGDEGRHDRRMVRVRRALWGHGYDTEKLDPQVLDRAMAVVEYREQWTLRELVQIVDERRDWVATA